MIERFLGRAALRLIAHTWVIYGVSSLVLSFVAIDSGHADYAAMAIIAAVLAVWNRN